MCVAPKHLAIHVSDFGWKGRWEARGFAKPRPSAHVIIERRARAQRWCVLGEAFGGEVSWIGDCSVDPALDVFYIVGCRDADRLAVLIHPSICCAAVM